MFALILVVWMQGAQSLTPVLVRVEVERAPFVSAAECSAAGALLAGPVLAETDSALRYTWRDVVCVPVAGIAALTGSGT